MTKRWIQEAVSPKNKGELIAYVRRYHPRSFTDRDTIKVSLLEYLAKRNDHVGHMARGALGLRGANR